MAMMRAPVAELTGSKDFDDRFLRGKARRVPRCLDILVYEAVARNGFLAINSFACGEHAISVSITRSSQTRGDLASGH